MKTITLIITIMLLTIFGSDKIETKVSSNYSCSAIAEREGRCTGSASCSVCSNCSRCGHCSNGGSCGVCSGSSSNNFYTPKPKRKTKSKTSTYYSTPVKESKNYYENETITIYAKLINVREKPTTESEVLEQLSSGDEILFIQKEGEWSKVQIKQTGTIGYVLSKLLN